jgi:hypothetical protein
MAISKHDKQALSQLFIDMGVPLIVAMQTVESWSGEDIELSKKAENLAKLLNISVEFATKVIKKLEIRDAYTLEAVRGKIIRIVTPIIAEIYVAGGNTPEDSKIAELTDLFDVLISFSDSVTPSEDDKVKPHEMARVIESCEPILAAINDHSFGLETEPALQKIMDGIYARVNELGASLNVDDVSQSGLMRAMVRLYVSCYRSCVSKVEAGADIAGEEALDAIWKDCDERMALIRGLTSYVGDKVGIETPKAQTQKPKSDTNKEKPEEKKIDKKSDKEESKDSDNSDDDDEDFNPMAFFG